MKTAHRHAAILTTAALLALLPALATAQAIYRIVGPDGRVSFSDKPPANSDGKATALSASGRSGNSGISVDLPFELRQAMNRYPITLYTGDDCAPCNAGRSMLNNRGIPFSERTIKTANDAEAFKAISREQSLPVLTIGGQQLKGFSAPEWSQYLDVAGYPQASVLPSGYRNPAAMPLSPLSETTTTQNSPEPAQASPQATQPVQLPPPGPSPGNPAGIVF